MVKPFIIGTRNAKDMLRYGVEALRDGGSSFDEGEGEGAQPQEGEARR